MSRLTIGPVRLSYAYIFEPRPVQAPGQKAKYGASLLIPKSAVQTAGKINAAIEETKQAYLVNNSKALWVRNAKTTFYDGDGLRPSGEEFSEEAKGHWVLSTSAQKQPMVVDLAKQPIMDSSLVYSGCFALAVINFYAYDTAGNKGIACALDGLMKTADGPALSGYTIASSDWDNIAANDLLQLNNNMME